ncbi:MAG: methyltransferase domain-containing protein [Deltaproteobacteria bacterium]|nr:methyltransferase domain-containing protein [Deltaproteobacteria bacterium]
MIIAVPASRPPLVVRGVDSSTSAVETGVAVNGPASQLNRASPRDVVAVPSAVVPSPPQIDVNKAFAARLQGPLPARVHPTNETISIDRIDVIQSTLRHSPDEMAALKADIARNDLKTPLKLMAFEDGRIFVRDGRHRLQILKELGVTALTPAMYEIKHLTYDDLLQVVFCVGEDHKLDLSKSWITPFDPRTEKRQAEIAPYKQLIKMLFDNGADPHELALFIRTHPELYLSLDDGVTIEKDGRDWDRYLKEMQASMPPKIAQLLPLIPNHGVVLDMGCGSGDQSYAYAVFFPGITTMGVDLSGNAIAFARARFNTPNLVFCQGNALTPGLPHAAVSAVTSSSTEHHFFSFAGGGYDVNSLTAYYRTAHGVLNGGGTFGCRDFTAARWPARVRVYLPTKRETGEGAHGAYSRAELFKIFARDFRTEKYPNGVPYSELPSSRQGFACFEVDGRCAHNFILRMEYRKDWEAELKEDYLPLGFLERIRALQAAGLRVDAATEIHSSWIYNHWWRSRLHVTDTDGNDIDLPPTNGLFLAVKPGASDPTDLQITAERQEQGSDELSIKSYARKDTKGITYDLIETTPTEQYIPYQVDRDGNVYLFVKKQVMRPALAYYAAHTHETLHYSGYTVAPFSTEISGNGDDISLPERIKTALPPLISASIKSEGDDLQTIEGSPYLPIPGISNETTRTQFVPVGGLDPEALDDAHVIRLELKQLIGAAHVGSIPDARLESAAYALAARLGLSLNMWFDGALPREEQQTPWLTAAEGYAALRPLNNDPLYEEATRGAGYAGITSLEVSEGFADGTKHMETHDVVTPNQHSLDTQSVIPYVQSNGEIYVGLETRELPAFETRGFGATQAVVPAWRLPKGIKNRTEAGHFIGKKMETDFNMRALNLTPLGEGYFPTNSQSPERVTPFAVQLDASHPPKDLTFVSLKNLLRDSDQIPDLHTRVAVHRLAHAMGLIGQ